jgi:Domain of unknown function (DUF3510)
VHGRAFVDGAGAQQLGEAAAAGVVAGVVAAVNSLYQQTASDMLDAVRKTESSLKRLKKMRAAEAATDGQAATSDTDKIAMQLFLDVQVRVHRPRMELLYLDGGLGPCPLPKTNRTKLSYLDGGLLYLDGGLLYLDRLGSCPLPKTNRTKLSITENQ